MPVHILSDAPVILTISGDPIPGALRIVTSDCPGWTDGPVILSTDGPVDETCVLRLRVVATVAGTYHSNLHIEART